MDLYPALPPPGTPAGGAGRWTLERARRAVCSALASGVHGAGGVAGALAAGVIDVGAVTPIISPVFEALSLAKGMVDQMGHGRAELGELHFQCTLITTRIIVRYNSQGSIQEGIVTPLIVIVDDIRAFAKEYNGRGIFRRMARMVNDNGKIEALRGRLGVLLAITAVEGNARIAEEVALMRTEMMARIEDVMRRTTPSAGAHMGSSAPPEPVRPALASVPNGRPADKAWHVVRERLVREISAGLAMGRDGDGDGPGLVGLVGRSGSGKTTCAAAVIGGAPAVLYRRPRGVEEEHGRAALDAPTSVRARFCDGVVWLRVGKGAGSPDRLPEVMRKLAAAVHSEILGCGGYRPGASPQNHLEGSAYIREALSCSGPDGGERKRCLVVADDVWESQVLEELKQTGMSVLVTTRNGQLVADAGGRVVEVDCLTETEAESVLRGAAELPAGARFPAAAADILDRCDRMAMHLEFVGRWSNVRGSEDNSDWQEAVEAIDTELEEVQRSNADTQQADGIDPFHSQDRRVAILRAGFNNLAALDPNNRSLYLALALLPDGHAFTTKEASVLLFDNWDTKVENAARVLGVLEQWAVVRVEGSMYRMHDAHVKFAKSRLIHNHNEDVREKVVRRWGAHISSLDALACVDNQRLRELWGSLESAGGVSWHDKDPYRPALDALDDDDPLCFDSLLALVSLYYSESEWESIDPVATRLLRLQDARRDAEGIKHALVMLIHSANRADRPEDGDEYRGRLSEMLDSETMEEFDRERHGDQHVIRALAARGQRLDMANRCPEARTTLEDALRIQEETDSCEKLEVARISKSLARVLRNLGLGAEAAEAYQQILSTMEDVLGHNDLGLATTLHDLATALCTLARFGEAAAVFQRCLNISEARGLDNTSVTGTLLSFASCLGELGRHEEAAGLRERARMGIPIRRSSS